MPDLAGLPATALEGFCWNDARAHGRLIFDHRPPDVAGTYEEAAALSVVVR